MHFYTFNQTFLKASRTFAFEYFLPAYVKVKFSSCCSTIRARSPVCSPNSCCRIALKFSLYSKSFSPPREGPGSFA